MTRWVTLIVVYMLLALAPSVSSAAIFFDSSFECPVTGTAQDFPCEGWNDFGQEKTNIFRLSTQQAFSGTKSVHLTYDNTDNASIWHTFPQSNHIFLRVAIYQVAGYVPGGAGNNASKRIRFRANNSSVNDPNPSDGLGSYPIFWLYNYEGAHAINVEQPCDNKPGGFWLTAGTPLSNVWDQVEVEIWMNTGGLANGGLRIWVNGQLRREELNRKWVSATPNGTCPGGLWHPSDWTTNEAQLYKQSGIGNVFFDRIAVGNTRIGLVSGTQPPLDTIDPTTPTNPTATVSGNTASLGWGGSTDSGGSGLSGYQLFRCSGNPCTMGASFTTVSATTTSYSDQNLAPGNYGYAYKAFDGAGRTSGFTTPIQYVTVTSSPIFFTPIFTDTFNRAGPTLGANWTGSFTGNADFSIVSQQVRVGSVSQDSMQHYNGTTANDQYNSIQLVAVGGAGTVAPGLLVRAQAGPAVSGYECRIIYPSTSRIAEWTAGSHATLVTNNIASWTWQALDIPQCEAQGTALRFYAIRAGVKTLLASTTDGSYGTGKTGLIHFVQNTGGNTTSTSQLDNYTYGTISTTPPTPPSILSLSATGTTTAPATSATVTWNLTTPPTQIRMHYGDNAGLFSYNQKHPISDFPSGVWTHTFLDGTEFLVASAIGADGTENTDPNSTRAINMIGKVRPVDTSPVVFGATFPVGDRPAGTTSADFGVSINKLPTTCRWDTTDHDYDLMPDDAAHAMSIASLVASSTVSGLSSASPTTVYVGCQFTNTIDATYNSPINQAVTITVAASTPDPTPPGNVAFGSLVATAIPDSADISAVWTAVPGAIGYQVYLATGDCSVFSVSGNPVAAATFQTTLTPFTTYCLKVKAIGSNNVLSAEFSNTATVVTFGIPDHTAPPRMTGLRILGQPFSSSVLFAWNTQTDLPSGGPVRSQLEFCTGIGCTNFESKVPRIAESQQLVDLTPGTFNRVRGIHYDLAGNPSGGLGTEDYSDIVEFTTATSGLSVGREARSFDPDEIEVPREAATREGR